MKRMMIFIAALVAFLGVAFFNQGHQRKQAQVPLVGILQPLSHPALDAIHKGIEAGLAKSGYKAGSVRFDFQNAQGDQSNLKTMAERFTTENAAVTVGIATPAAQALANANQSTPVVLGAVTDPKGAKLVKDNAHPGGNVTGVSDQPPLKAQLQLIKTLMPKAKVLGLIGTSSDDSAQSQIRQMQALAPKYGFTVKTYAISNTNDLTQVANQMVTQVDAIYVPTDNTIASAMQTLVAAANARKVPIFPSVDTMVEQGGLAAIGLDQFQLGVETGKMVAKILKGADPATTPIHFETNGQLILNDKVARQLGITIPKSVAHTAQTQGKVIQ
ncbi:tryptophan ABC transporter substrate-binding protein [Lacticaseibacillus brantae]|uniref:ABC-type uncharacterized transport system, periplasmic component n=1 Tax=Lacticaseibacillus brantae DSM 23927 TaxID=1423727 RepID=A0A0R2B1J0_9LACO|nr:tryptophan ABC transporter substrate-binding protein [Lacticaseibacillus brantae]KRM73103.1 ABC-type uncharacterized transport system, periplasmic component [Lacticaseibacillus brantae DSM 23927]